MKIIRILFWKVIRFMMGIGHAVFAIIHTVFFSVLDIIISFMFIWEDNGDDLKMYTAIFNPEKMKNARKALYQDYFNDDKRESDTTEY